MKTVIKHHERSRGTWRLAAALVVGLMVALVAPIATAPAQAVTASPAAEAAGIYRQAKALRSETSGLLGQYVNEYADRFTPAEIAKLKALQAESDGYLVQVVNATQRVSTIANSKASVRRVAAAAATAGAAQKRARAAEAAAFEKARPIVEPKLSLFERLDAVNKYNTMMGKLDELGTRIDRLAKRRS